MKHIDLFSGIGGFSCASHRLGFTTTRWADVNTFAQRVMVTRFPDAIGHDDVTKVEYSLHEADLITGGFPCQDFSRTRLFLPMRKEAEKLPMVRETYWDYTDIPNIVGEATYENKRALTAYGNAVAVPVAHFVLSTLLSVDNLAKVFTDLSWYPNAHSIRYFKESVPFIQARRGAYNRPTPVASDYKGASQRGRRRGTLCEEAVKAANPPDGATVYPNASFAEWMMGFPVGWCDI